MCPQTALFAGLACQVRETRFEPVTVDPSRAESHRLARDGHFDAEDVRDEEKSRHSPLSMSGGLGRKRGKRGPAPLLRAYPSWRPRGAGARVRRASRGP